MIVYFRSLLNITLMLTISCLLIHNCTGSNENEAESVSKIGQGVSHTMNIFYWYIINLLIKNL